MATPSKQTLRSPGSEWGKLDQLSPWRFIGRRWLQARVEQGIDPLRAQEHKPAN